MIIHAQTYPIKIVGIVLLLIINKTDKVYKLSLTPLSLLIACYVY